MPTFVLAILQELFKSSVFKELLFAYLFESNRHLGWFHGIHFTNSLLSSSLATIRSRSSRVLLRFCFKVHFCPGNPGLSMAKKGCVSQLWTARRTRWTWKRKGHRICDTEAPLNIGLSRDEQGFSKFWALWWWWCLWWPLMLVTMNWWIQG